MSFITRYWIVLFFFANICAHSALLRFAANPLFFASMGLGVVVIVGNLLNIVRHNILTKAKFCTLFAVFILLYQVFFGFSLIHAKSWTYFFSKITVCLAIAISVWSNYAYYKTIFLKILSITIALLLVYGAIRYPGSAGSRVVFGLGNANTVGCLAAICFGIVLITDLFQKKYRLLLLFVSMGSLLLSGSRCAMGAAVVAFIIKYGFRTKLVLALMMAYLIATIALPMLGVRGVGMERFTRSVAELNISEGRDIERKATILMIEEAPISGHGLYAGQSKAARQISELGSHCGFLDILKMMGIPIGGALIVLMFWQIAGLYFKFRKSHDSVCQAHLFIVVSVFLSTFFEGFIWGINEPPNTFLFISAVVLQLTSVKLHESQKIRLS